ncbi:MAG: type II toxin-antitoxin system RelE/ParE family toxin [Gemmatimonadaceae bacterium]
MAILQFRHRGLARFCQSGVSSGSQPRHSPHLRLILGRLDVAMKPGDMGLPGLGLHPLRGNRVGTWSVKVNSHWRVTFRFAGTDATDVDYEDYH